MPGNQYALVELARVEPGSVDNLSAAEQEAITQQLAQMQGDLAFREYRMALRNNADIVTR